MSTEQENKDQEPQTPFFWNVLSILGIVFSALLIVMLLD